MKKIFFILITVETLIIFLLIVIRNKNIIIHKQNVYDFKLDNGYIGQLSFDNGLENQFRGLSCKDKKNNYTSLIYDDKICFINFQNNSIYSSKYENDTGKYIIYVNNFEGNNIVYAINYSSIPQIINAEDFYKYGIIFQVDEPIK